MTVEAIKKQMLRMSKSELEELRRFAAVAGQSGGAPPDAITDAKGEVYCQMILESICLVLQSRDLDPTKPHALTRTQQYRAFREKIVEDKIGAWCDMVVKKNRIALRGLIRLAVDLLCDDLIQKRVAVNARVMMNHAHRIPAVLHRNFPGYAQYGMLYLVIRKEGE
jgi:hypothetical protein